MKKSLTWIPALAVAALAITAAAPKAEARGENELVRLAHEIEDIADELKDEFSIHFRHSGAYRHLMNDISQILGEARHIDGLAHDPHSSLRHLQADIEDLDDLAHHLHEVVDAVERGRYSGHIDGNTRHVHSMLDSLNRTIHSMERAVQSYAAPPRYDHHGHDDHGHGHDDHASYGSNRGRAAAAVIGGIIRLSRDRH